MSGLILLFFPFFPSIGIESNQDSRCNLYGTPIDAGRKLHLCANWRLDRTYRFIFQTGIQIYWIVSSRTLQVEKHGMIWKQAEWSLKTWKTEFDKSTESSAKMKEYQGEKGMEGFRKECPSEAWLARSVLLPHSLVLLFADLSEHDSEQLYSTQLVSQIG